MTPAARVLAAISADCWTKVDAIARAAGIEDPHATRPATRAIIADLVEIHRKPIISGSRGYKVAETRDELRRYADSLRRRAVAIFVRARAIRRMADEIPAEEFQSELFDMEATR